MIICEIIKKKKKKRTLLRIEIGGNERKTQTKACKFTVGPPPGFPSLVRQGRHFSIPQKKLKSLPLSLYSM